MRSYALSKSTEIRTPRLSEIRLRKEQESAISEHFNMEFNIQYLGRHHDADWKREVDEYVITLRNFITGKSYTTPFKAGIGLKNDGRVIKPYDVLSSIRLEDTRGESFEDWCWECGYDTDSRKALELYLLLQKQAGEFKKAFPKAALDSYEPLQDY